MTRTTRPPGDCGRGPPYPRERLWTDCEDELKEARTEIERLRGDFDGRHWRAVRAEAALAEARTEVERLREELLSRHNELRATAEGIERLREGLDSMIEHNDTQHAEIERLRQEKADILAAKEIVFAPPAIPESFVIQELQKANVALHADLARLRSGVRCPHCDKLRLELGQARRELAQLSGLLRETLDSECQFPDWFIKRVREALGE
jgi:DNA repair exonuclease SbcCD ATPase subunit